MFERLAYHLPFDMPFFAFVCGFFGVEFDVSDSEYELEADVPELPLQVDEDVFSILTSRVEVLLRRSLFWGSEGAWLFDDLRVTS